MASGDNGNDGQQPPDGTPGDAGVGATPEGGRDPRQVTAQLDFEMGLPLRTIGAKAGVSEGMVRKWAKAGGWKRGASAPESKNPKHRKPPPPAPTVSNVVAMRRKDDGGAPSTQSGTQNAVRTGTQEAGDVGCIPSGEGTTQKDDADAQLAAKRANKVEEIGEQVQAMAIQLLHTDQRDEAVEVAARAIVQVVRSHRSTIDRANRVANKLLDQLDLASGSRDLLTEFIEATTKPGKYQQMLKNLVSVASHAQTLKDLSTAMTRLVALERQAFAIPELHNAEPPAPPPPETVVAEDEWDAILRKVAERSGAPTEVTDVQARPA